MCGELLSGAALIVGPLRGPSAFSGGFMNAGYLLAGTISTDPVLFIVATWPVLAWRVAGYCGLEHLDRPGLGAPRGPDFGSRAQERAVGDGTGPRPPTPFPTSPVHARTLGRQRR